MTELVPLSTRSPAEVEVLLDHAFGPDRHARTAYKVRGSARPIDALSFAAVEFAAVGGWRLVGTIQCWPVTLTVDDGTAHPLVMIGPVAVKPARQQGGIGRELMTAALSAAAAGGLDDRLMLIGDPEYYGRFFGFTADATASWRLPGPVERRRLLARGDAVPMAAGVLGPAIAVAA